MKLLIRLIVLLVLGGAAYLYFVPNASISDLTNLLPNTAQSAQASDSSTPPAPSQAATPFPTPTPKPPETIRLKNGKTLVGNIVIRDPEITIIRTPDGKTTQFATKDVVTP
jgi:hypothetical protein